MKRTIIALAVLAGVVPARAQTYTRQQTPDPGQYVPVFAVACQDAQGRALPPGSAGCAGAQTVQGQANGTPVPTAEAGSGAASAGISPVVVQSGTSAVGKAAAGNLYGAYALNGTATAAFVAVVDAAAVPASGSAIAPRECRILPASGSVDFGYGAGPPDSYANGIVALVTTSCATYTPGGASFIRVRAR